MQYDEHRYSARLDESWSAADKAFQFIPSSSLWEVTLNTAIDVSIIHQSPIPKALKEDLLTVLAFRATDVGTKSLKDSLSGVKQFIQNLDGQLTPTSAQRSYDNITSKTYKDSFSYAMKNCVNAGNTYQSEALNVLYLNNIQNYKSTQFKRKIFDPIKGAHTPLELESLMEGMRLLTNEMHLKLNEDHPFHRTKGHSGFLMGGLSLVLMISILRRPVQLCQIKMGDFRTRNGSFDNTFSNENILLDYDELKLQTYQAKGKDSKERTVLDEDLHILNRANSKLIIRYSSKMFTEHIERLYEQGIVLTSEEKKELFKRFPLFPAYAHIAATHIRTKEQLFQATHIETTANHIVKQSLNTATFKIIDNVLQPIYNSERITTHTERITGNNRLRHTILTIGARDGLDAVTLAALTGVTPQAAKAYIDMTPQERAMIDETFGKNATLVNFGKIRIQEQLHSNDEIAFDEFGNEYGTFETETRCAGCRERLPVPICCYGCDNFTALSTGNHEAQLKKVLKKYNFNKRNGQSEQSLKRLEKAIVRIKATISACNVHNYRELGRND
ncbi:hypothetical protein CGJ62_22335 [Vibrio parahaemolyticus]|nr:hypothetical protein CGJ62_22335 [Vibrio parahaemolyticus]